VLLSDVKYCPRYDITPTSTLYQMTTAADNDRRHTAMPIKSFARKDQFSDSENSPAFSDEDSAAGLSGAEKLLASPAGVGRSSAVSYDDSPPAGFSSSPDLLSTGDSSGIEPLATKLRSRSCGCVLDGGVDGWRWRKLFSTSAVGHNNKNNMHLISTNQLSLCLIMIIIITIIILSVIV